MRFIWTWAVACALGAAFGGEAPLELALGLDGNVAIGATGARLGVVIHAQGWSGSAHATCTDWSVRTNATETASCVFLNGNTRLATGRTTLLPLADGRALLAAQVVSALDQTPESVVLSMDLPVAAFAGGTWRDARGRTGRFAADWDGKTVGLYGGETESLTLRDARGTAVTFAFPGGASCMIQDNRTWRMSSFTLRIGGGRRSFRAGDERTFLCLVSAPGGTRVTDCRAVVVKAGPEWIPLDYRKDVEAGSALDFSNQGLQDAPAGKYGWLRNKDGHFEFEGRPGVRQRFYGVNLCFDANFPDRAFADELAARLARLGYNAVRIHHYESDAGAVKGSADGVSLNAERMEKLDYFLARLYEKGLYVTTDLFTIRPVAWRTLGIDRPGNVPTQVYKNLLPVLPAAYENWCAFARNLLLHVNPHTGRAYKDEPALPLVSLVNEGHLTWCWDKIRKEPCVRKAWAAWRARNAAAASIPEDPARVGKSRHAAALIAFMADCERDLVTRQRAFLRGLGVRALLTNQNCGPHYAPLMAVCDDLYDYVDDHFYVDHPHFLARPWSLPSSCGNANPLLSAVPPPAASAFTRMPAKPFCITEWNFSGPGMYRGVGGILTGAMGALQDWDGLWRFAYAHGLDAMRDRTGHPGYFDVASDPLGLAGDRASLCLFLRGDLAPLEPSVANRFTEKDLALSVNPPLNVVPRWSAAAWRLRVGTTCAPVPGMPSFDLAAVGTNTAPPVAAAPARGLVFDRARGSFRIETPRTAGGFVPAGACTAGPVSFDVGTVPATVWASALDAKPIRTSSRLLVTHLTDVQADGNVYADATKRTLLAWGAYPPVVRAGRARLALALDEPAACTVWALASTGRRLARIPATVEDGRLTFTASVDGPQGACLFYEVVRAEK